MKNNHLCYKCGEKYGQGHQCKNSQFTYMLVDESKDLDFLSMCEELEKETSIQKIIKTNII